MNPRIKQRQVKAGVSLVEAMVAIVVLGILAVSTWSSMAAAHKARFRARSQQAALIEANTSLETAMAMVDSNTCPVSTSCWLDENYNSTQNTNRMSWTLDGVSYSKQIALTNNHNLVHINVGVNWSDGQIKLESYKCVR